MRIAFRLEPTARARSLFSPLQFHTKDTSLVSLVLAEQPLVMELPLVSPASCELRSVIRFLAAKKNSAKDIHTELCQLSDLVPDVSKTTIDKNLREHLGYSKVCAIWVPKMLTEDHKRQWVDAAQKFLDCHKTDGEEFLDSIEQSKQWKHTSSPKPLKFKQTLSAGKLIATVFWGRKGLLLCDFMRRGTTINSNWYCEILKQLRRVIQNKRRGMLTKGVRFHHDNARPHTAHQTTALIEEFGWELVSHPPYSPDVAPSDFHFFPELKKNLGGTQFQDDDEFGRSGFRLSTRPGGRVFDSGFHKIVNHQMVLQYKLSTESVAQESVYGFLLILLIAAVKILQQTHLLEGKEVVTLIIGPEIYKSKKEQKRKGRAASNKIDDTHVVKHIKSFPAYTSHYTRAHNPRRQYLNPDLNIKKMYELYATQCKKENVVPVKEKYYYKVFSTKFNLHFKQPSKDTCQTCDYLQIKIQSSDSEGIQMAKIEKENHLEEAERARSLMAADRKAASDKIFVFSFDLEKALAFPKLTTSVAYYKRNLYVYNFGCHDFNENIGHMFVWPETEGSLNWLKMRWIKLERSKSHIIQFKYDHNENSEFYAIDIRKFVAGRPQSLKNIDQPLLYPKGRTVTSEKRRDMMALLKFIPPVKQSYFKNLRTNRNDESLHTADEEDIIYVADELITNNNIL
ncbi:hypothetical protein LAZ67_9002822 [Cordylochernes scorpioides]|uniref:Transposase n=1 Tax=Cordylochernes scorpioides TaxID=51811 RepID=A0ABY6KVR6_9ARAC|nr:hypothetical protein LAZ67_9002822 [Cordylochernes scorpioides]